jgi:hypothetical protein
MLNRHKKCWNLFLLTTKKSFTNYQTRLELLFHETVTYFWYVIWFVQFLSHLRSMASQGRKLFMLFCGNKTPLRTPDFNWLDKFLESKASVFDSALYLLSLSEGLTTRTFQPKFKNIVPRRIRNNPLHKLNRQRDLEMYAPHIDTNSAIEIE